MKKLFFLLAMLLTTVGAFAQGQYRTVIIAKLVLGGNAGESADMRYPIRAYVGDELRGEAYPGAGNWGDVSYGTTYDNDLYMIEVWSNPEGATSDLDNGKNIRLELVDYFGQQQYELTYSFQKTYKITGTENTYGTLSNPEVLKITLPKKEDYALPLYEVEKGKNYTLADYLQYTKGATLPNNVKWEVGTPDPTGASTLTPVNGVTVENGVLKVTDFVYDQVKLQLVPNSDMAGATAYAEPLVESYLNIVLHANKITLKPDAMTMTVENSDYGIMQLDNATMRAEEGNAPYIIAPDETTDRYVQWEVEGQTNGPAGTIGGGTDGDAPLLTFTGNGFYITKGKSGSVRVRPYIEYVDRNNQTAGAEAGSMVKIVPTDANGNETWITVNVFVPVERLNVNTGLYYFDGSNPNIHLNANKSDKNIYDRLAKMIKVYPENAEQGFKFKYTGDVLKIEGNKITALKAGTGIITVESVGKTETKVNYNETGEATVTEGSVETARINFSIWDPATSVTFDENPLQVTLTDNAAQDITQKISENIHFDGSTDFVLSTGTFKYNTSIEVSITGDGTSVERRAGQDATAVNYAYWAVKDGETDFIVKLAWYDWATFMGDGTVPTILTNGDGQTFSINVGNQLTLKGLIATVENNVAGEEVTITLKPSPANASDFNPQNINLSFQYVVNPAWAGNNTTFLANITKWANTVVENVGRTDATAKDKIVWKFKSPIAGIVKINGAPVPISQPNVQPVVVSTTGDKSNPYVNVGYNLSLDKGWQWRSNPWGRVTKEQIEGVYGENMQEIRTSADLLFNEKNYGMYGSLLNNEKGIPMFESYKVRMAEALPSSVIYGNPLTDISPNYMPANVQYNATSGVVSVTLKKGWNWVGCPYFFNRSLETIIAKAAELSNVRIPDDFSIVSKSKGYKIYKNQTPAGELQYLEAGQGYQIYNPGDEITLQFPVEMLYYLPNNEDNGAANSVKGLGLGGTPWRYDHSRFMNNMSLVTVLEGISNPEDYSIGAFVGDECRGESYFEDGIMFITVHCDAGEYVKFRLYNTLTGETEEIKEGVRAQQRVGSLRSPFLLHGTATGISGIDANASETESFDLTGRRTNGQLRGISIQRNANGNYRKIMK